jgi:thiamine-monophosphate kinase
MPPNEFDIIARYFAPIAGPGALGLLDDAAILAPPPGHDLVLTKDMLVDSVHFLPDDPPRAIAMKALRVNLSDLAAKGAEPLGCLLGLALPRGMPERFFAGFAEGLAADMATYRIALLGGDTVSTDGPLTVSITAIGSVPVGRMVRRLTARPGDVLYVTGMIGDSAIGLQIRRKPDAAWVRALSGSARAWLLDAYLLPRPRNAIAGLIRTYASAAMDVSDGFVGDLTKMMLGAGIGATVRLDAVPLSPAALEAIRTEPGLRDVALTGGDDYEVLFAVPPDRGPDMLAAFAAAGVPATRIGEATRSGLRFLVADGSERRFASGSYRHF